MDVKEKLVELCEDVILSCKSSLCNDCEHNGIDYPHCMGVHFADYLIAHGVTVQEWISVKDRLPKDMVDVLTCDAKGNIHIMWHHHEYQYPFNIGRSDIRYFPVTHWMPLPQPPKGE